MKLELFISVLFFFVSGTRLLACDCGPLEKLDKSLRKNMKIPMWCLQEELFHYRRDGYFKVGVTESFKGNIKKDKYLLVTMIQTVNLI